MLYMRHLLIFWPLFGLPLLSLTGCWHTPTDEERVRSVVQAVITGAEDGDVGDVMAHVSKRYQDDSELDQEGIRGVLTMEFMKRGPILVVPGPIQVVVTGATAHATFDAAIAEGSGKWTDVMPVSADGWHLNVDLVREEGDAWRVRSHTLTSWNRP